MGTGKAKVVINPVAGGGRVGRRWPGIREALLREGLIFDAELTERPGHATEIARQALREGYRHVVAIGGDGTVNEVVNGLVVDGQVPSDLSLSIIPGGTGSDLSRYLGLGRFTAQATQPLLGQRIRTVDIGEIQCMYEGRPFTRYFVNVAGLGFDGETCIRVNRMSKRMSGTIPYLTGLVVTLLTYTNKDVTLRFDGQEMQGRFNSVIICNGQYFGGGMWIGPRAAADDGLFDVVILKDLNKLEFLLNVPRVYKGTHLTHPQVETFQARQVHVEAKQPMFIQAEGDLVGETPASFRLLPGALHLRV